MTTPAATAIHGDVSPGFEPVRDAFVENFARRNELGAACCVYRHGEKVVDIWGGVHSPGSARPFAADTMVIVYSATKGFSAMALAVAHSRGWLDYDARIADYWPEFAQAGKAAITVRQLLAHQAGLHYFSAPVDWAVVANLDRLAAVMARQRPAWPPGERQAYHAITLGFYENELMRRVDPHHRTIGQVFQDEIATPLSADAYIRLPETVPDGRLAPLQPAGAVRMILSLPLSGVLAAFNPRSHFYRSMIANPGTAVPTDAEHVYRRNFEVPSGGGVASARGIARTYGAFSTGGAELGLRRETLAALSAPPVQSARGFHDECVKGECAFSLGFMVPNPGFPFGHEGAFGSPGAGGSMGYADPATGIGYGYVTNRMGVGITGDPRDVALRDALAAVAG